MAASTSSSMSKLSKFREELQTLRSKLEPLSSVPDLGALSEHLGSLENARLNVLYAYTVNALLYMHLKVQGVRTADHPIKEELERVKQYFQKIEDVEKQIEREKGNSTSGLDKEASKRFIKHALNGNNYTNTQQQENGRSSTQSASVSANTEKADENTEEDSCEDEGEKKPKSKKSKAATTGKMKAASKTNAALGDSASSKGLSSSKRSTPMPNLTHLNWKEELKKRRKH